MSKIRTIAFSIFTALALAVGAWGYLHVRHHKKPTSDPLRYIPNDALCVWQSNSFRELVNQLTHQNLIWQSLDSAEALQDITAGLHYFDSLLSSSDEVDAIIRDNTLYHALYKKENATDQLLVFELKDHDDGGVVGRFLQTHFKKQAELTQAVYNVPVAKGQDWYITTQGDLLFLSSELGLLQRSVNLDPKSALALDSNYTSLKALDNEQFCKVYLAAHSGIFNRHMLNGYSALNLEIEPNSIHLTGYNKPERASLLSRFSNQKPGSLACLPYLPKNTICFTTQIAGDATAFFEADAPAAFSKQWQVLNDSALYNIRHELEDNLGGEFTSLSYTGVAQQKEDLFVFSVKDDSPCNNLLRLMSDSVVHASVNAGDLEIVKIRKACDRVFGAMAGGAVAAFAYNNYVFVFSSVSEALAHAQRINSSEVLSKDPGFMAFASQNLVQENNFIYYENPGLVLAQGLSGLIGWQGLRARQDKLAYICFTALSTKDVMLVRINMEYKQTASMDGGQSYLWVLHADTTIRTEAFPFKNHATGGNELAFQDESNVLYLANATGALLWKKKLNEPVRSTIYTVDIFRNNKYQLFFNTDNYLHLVDRNGNYVQGYPVRLPARATSPVVAYDYDNNKDLRLLLACADHKIYNYTLYGVKNEGYTPFRTDAEVNLPVQYIKVAGSDYLVTADKEGKVYVFSRKGEGRVSLRNNAAPGLQSFYMEAGSSIQTTKFVYIDNQHNSLCKITLDDKKQIIELDNDIAGFSSSYDLLNDDRQTNVMLYGAGAVFAYDLFGSKLMESYSGSAVYGDVVHEGSLDENVVLAYDKTGRKIDVLSGSGASLRTVKGCTQKPLSFKLFGDNKQYLLIVDGRELKCLK